MRRSYDRCMPSAREEDLIVKRLADEVLVYDLRSDKAHCLNHTAAFIWDRCDGETDVSEIARLLSEHIKVPVDEHFVLVGLGALSRVRLLNLNQKGVKPADRLSRRQLIRRAGAIAALATLPAVASIVAPMAVSAASCSTVLQPCGGSNPPCCAGLGLDCQLGICIQL